MIYMSLKIIIEKEGIEFVWFVGDYIYGLSSFADIKKVKNMVKQTLFTTNKRDQLLW